MNYDVTCPHCSQKLTISEEHIDNICLCPHCHEEVCFNMEDIELEKKMQMDLEKKIQEENNRIREKNIRIQEENKRRLKMQSRRKTSFKFIIAKFNDVERIVNMLYWEEGWYVISQSTVFLSESSGSIGGFGSGRREEGLALILRKDD